MHKLLLAGGLLLGPALAQAQNNALKVDILQPIVNTGHFSFEHKLSESSSLQIGLAFTANYKEDGNFIVGNYYEGRTTSGFTFLPEYRFYLSEKTPALQGFYVAPFARYQYLSQTGSANYYNPTGPTYYQQYEATLNSLGVGVTVGRHWVFKKRFSLDVFLGPSYTVSTISSDFDGVSQGSFVGYADNINYGLRGGISFGIAF